uniref:conjugal transfer protein TrbJ n=1 Tax=Escherichia coli TaxID=562 RepID=UPI0035309DB0
MRNKQVVLLIAGISGIATGIIVSLNIPFIRQGLFYPASPVEIVVSLCLTFSVSVVFFVGAIVGWISVSYYTFTAVGLGGCMLPAAVSAGRGASWLCHD